MLNTILAFSQACIAVVGDVMLDRYVTGEARRLSREAPIPVMTVQSERTMAGGAANVARNIATLGGHATLVGLIGLDEEGSVLEAVLGTEPRLVTRLLRHPARPTTVKRRYMAQGQQLLRVDRETTSPVDETTAAALLDSVAASLTIARMLVLSDYANGVLRPSVIERTMALARTRDATVIVAPRSQDMRIYRGAAVIMANAMEASLATGINCEDDAGVAEAARQIADVVGCRHVVITRGAKGMTVIGATEANAGAVHLRARVREVHDVSGAGDTALATLALALSVGAPIERAATLANIAAGISVSKAGTAAVSLEELTAGIDPAGQASGVKLVGAADAQRQARLWREQGKTVVFTNGCFDLLHPGHIRVLRHAKAEGDRLIVGLNSDASVSRLKGPGRPIQTEEARATVMASNESVDLVVIFDEDTPLDLIEAIQPDVLVKGADYTEDRVVGADFVRSYGGRVVLVPLEAGYSTSATIDKAARGPHDLRATRNPDRA